MTLFGERIAVSDGALRTAAGTLAGAHLDLSQAVRNATTLLGAKREQALQMASATPAEFLRQEQNVGRIAVGNRADLILLDDSLTPQRVWISGVPVL
jgi:N-acetylglucosamine-6-phosphate deacetylase